MTTIFAFHLCALVQFPPTLVVTLSGLTLPLESGSTPLHAVSYIAARPGESWSLVTFSMQPKSQGGRRKASSMAKDLKNAQAMTEDSPPASPEDSPTIPGEKSDVVVRRDAANPDDGTSQASSEGVCLIPEPSSDPNDPLNWSWKRKSLVAMVVYICVFTGFCAPFNGQIQLVQQAALYSKTTVQISYFVSPSISPRPPHGPRGVADQVLHSELRCLGRACCQLLVLVAVGALDSTPFLSCLATEAKTPTYVKTSRRLKMRTGKVSY